jgi:uncharacterized repeat protein (TIGR04042 family)
MPEMHFIVQWPAGDQMRCYSPSLIVREYLQVGGRYPVEEFVARSRTMLNIASERVKAKYGYICTAALDQLAEIEARAAAQPPSVAFVTVVAFELPEEAPP